MFMGWPISSALLSAEEITLRASSRVTLAGIELFSFPRFS
jgi:hypothetical protein